MPPYPELCGGAVLSATIDLYAYASVAPPTAAESQLHSPDLQTAAALAGREELARAVLSEFTHNADVVLYCDAPPGSGLGSSSSMIVALLVALAEQSGEAMTPYELAELAVRIEREGLRIPGGLQDQYASAFGGFNFIEFEGDGVLVTPLRPRPEVLAELQSTVLLVPTPVVSRRSGGILTRQIAAYEREDEEVMLALSNIKSQALEAKSALLRGDLTALAEVLDAGWHSKRRLSAGVATPEIEELYEDARRLGAVGGKLLGAGGGGFLLLMVPFDDRGDVVAGLRRRSCEPVKVSFVEEGARAWRRRA